MDQEIPSAQSAPDAATPRDQSVKTNPRRRSVRGRLIRLAINLVIIYIGVCVGMGCLQNKIIFPGAASQGQKTAIVPPSTKYELIELKTLDGDRTIAVFGSATDESFNVLPDAQRRPTAIIFYGNGAFLAHALGDVSFFRAMGLNVLMVEYVGYGMASGKPSEKALYATADAAYAHLMSREDIDRNNIIAIGMSIGAAPAIDLASRQPIRGLICFSPFTSITAMGRYAIPWLPTSLILSYRFDNLSKIKSIDAPVFIAHGKQDRTVPFYMSEELSRAAKGKVTFVPYDDADHNDIFEVGGDELEEELRRFIEQFQPAR